MLDQTSNNVVPVDVLSDVLQELRPRGVNYGHCILGAPWGVVVDGDGTARLHVVVAGNAFFRNGAEEWIELRQGDMVFLPSSTGHALAASPDSTLMPLASLPREPIGERTFRLSAGGAGSKTLMACCSVRFEEPTVHPLLRMMPPAVIIRQAVANDPALPALLDAMAEEVMQQRIGAASILARLADIVIIRLIRAWVEERRHDRAGWIAAMEDRRIGKVLVELHRNPGADWTIDTLANVAGMSRSAFYTSFTSLLGMSPLRYLSQWRMRLASAWLTHDRMTVASAAQRLGYESEAAFSRAFKRVTGVTPGRLRQL